MQLTLHDRPLWPNVTRVCSTTGGSGGTTTTVTTLAALTSAVTGDAKKIVIVSGTITGNVVVKVRAFPKWPYMTTEFHLYNRSARTLASLGRAEPVRFISDLITRRPLTHLLVALVGVGLRVLDVSNVIIRNLKISKVLADAGDAVAVQASSNVWIDHLDLSSDRDHDKD